MCIIVQWPIRYIPVKQKPVLLRIFMRILRWLIEEKNLREKHRDCARRTTSEDAKGCAVGVKDLRRWRPWSAVSCVYTFACGWVGGFGNVLCCLFSSPLADDTSGGWKTRRQRTTRRQGMETLLFGRQREREENVTVAIPVDKIADNCYLLCP